MRESHDTVVARIVNCVLRVLIRGGLLEGGQGVRIALTDSAVDVEREILRVVIVAGSRGRRGAARILHMGALTAGTVKSWSVLMEIVLISLAKVGRVRVKGDGCCFIRGYLTSLTRVSFLSGIARSFSSVVGFLVLHVGIDRFSSWGYHQVRRGGAPMLLRFAGLPIRVSSAPPLLSPRRRILVA